MPTFKCKMCGGTIEFKPGMTVGLCDTCATKQTLPHLDNEGHEGLYDQANSLFCRKEFDKAAELYRQIVSENSADAEAHWSLLLCRYGVEYVKDADTQKRIPRVTRVQDASLFEDENYKSALHYADGYQRALYEMSAIAINDAIKKGAAAAPKDAKPAAEKAEPEKTAMPRKSPLSILLPIAAACILLIILLISVIIPNSKYNAAVELYQEGQYDEAISAFTALNGYKDSDAMIEQCILEKNGQ